MPRRVLFVESLENRRLLAADCFQNPLDPNDVNADRSFDVTDLRLVFSEFVADDTGEGESVRHFIDVNGDGQVSIADLREIFVNTIDELQSVDLNLDGLAEQVADVAENSETINELISNWQNGPAETIEETLDQLLATRDDRIDALRTDLAAFFDGRDETLAELYDEIDEALAAGLENAGDAIDDVRDRWAEVQTNVQDQTEAALQQVLDGDRLREHVGEFLTQVGLNDLQQDFTSFIDELEAGQVPLTEDAQALVDLFQSPTFEISFETLGNLDLEQFRGGIADLLTAYEGTGRDLPAEAVELRDALDNGETIVSFVLSRINLPPLPGILDGLLGIFF